MKLSNFKLIEVIGTSPITWKFRATVLCTTKKWFFSKPISETKDIFKSYTGSWCFVETGEYTPNYDVQKLERIFTSKNGRDLEECLSS